MRLAFLITIAGMFLSAMILAETETPRPAVRVESVAPHFHLLQCDFGPHYVNVTAFDGPDGTLLVDTGHRKSAQALVAELDQLQLGDVSCVINTHFHGDHVGGNSVFGDARIIAHAKTQERLLEGAGNTAAGLPGLAISDSLTRFFNGDTVRIIHLPNGHTDSDLIVYFVKANIVCMGDLLFADAFPLIFRGQGGSADGYIANLGNALAMFPRDAVVIPGHGRIYTMAELSKYHDMLVESTKRVRAAFASGQDLDQVYAADVLRPGQDWVSREYVDDSAFVHIVWDQDRHQ